jgi:hypothetical protein
MADISIYDLRPTGTDLFDGQESYLQELSDPELNIHGGLSPTIILSIVVCPSLAAAAYGVYKSALCIK